MASCLGALRVRYRKGLLAGKLKHQLTSLVIPPGVGALLQRFMAESHKPIAPIMWVHGWGRQASDSGFASASRNLSTDHAPVSCFCPPPAPTHRRVDLASCPRRRELSREARSAWLACAPPPPPPSHYYHHFSCPYICCALPCICNIITFPTPRDVQVIQYSKYTRCP